MYPPIGQLRNSSDCGARALSVGSLFVLIAPFLSAADTPSGSDVRVTVINMIPKSLSGETNQDSEPNLAVNPTNPQLMAGSAFTPDPIYGPRCPIYISTDEGNTWSLNSIVPSQAGSKTGTYDITLRFGAGRTLYAGILRLPNPVRYPRLNILRTEDFAAPSMMKVLVDRTGSGVDQPYVQTAALKDASGSAKDVVFIGDNDFNGQDGRTAAVDYSVDGANLGVPFKLRRLEVRNTPSQDGPEIRPIISSDGHTIYAIFYGWRAWDDASEVATFDLVVVRDDDDASGISPFNSLIDPNDHKAGMRVVTGRKIPFKEDFLGNDRVGGDPAIAVDPSHAAMVYVAWSDLVDGALVLHVRRSTDGGATWSQDLRAISNAKNPGIAINNQGTVAFVYQQVEKTGNPVTQRWITRFEQTTDEFKSKKTFDLANTPADQPTPLFLPYLGDYLHVMSVGNDFYGVFSANNTPDKANFPSGVRFQRNANLVTKTLLAVDNHTSVPSSIDPFFFKVTEPVR
jgi:hypothetical protein